VDIVPGVPARAGGGRIVWAADSGGAKRLLVGTPAELAAGAGGAGGAGAAVTPPALQVREILSVDGDAVLFTASADDPTAIGLWLQRPGGLTEISPPGGVHAGTRSGGTTVLTSRTMTQPGPSVRVLTDTPAHPAAAEALQIASLAELPNVPAPHPDQFAAGAREIRSTLLLPSWHEPGSGPLPVLLDPYGGPHAQRVLAAQGAFLTSQWLAEQGFAVLVADGRGTPGRGPEWERAVWHDLATPALEDQVEALQAAAARYPDLDTSRVAIRGWSFGGYLSALAVLRRPDVFHAAVAGAPLTDMISMYSLVYWNSGGTNQAIFESSQGRFSGGYWDNLEAYQRNSPVYYARNVHTPLMILHNDKDGAVDHTQGIEYFNTLRRLGKPVIMLEYKGENHGLRKPENMKDYTVRMKEWFDHYLMDKPAPQWMEEGVPLLKMKDHLEERTKEMNKTTEPAEPPKTTGSGGQ
jgi:dipeptidyl-peptidase-4